jgi:2',3'-cyclic-nucleotide 2'-phosphodiesterase (5'-nucleotidase family)
MNFLKILFILICFPVLVSAQPWSILVTGDMHGWLQPVSREGETLGGAAEMLSAWQKKEGLDKSRFLVLSAGDIATGPAIGTVFKGESVVEAMNMMGYDASALGNHEFDFGIDQIGKLKSLAKFPFLCANLLDAEAKPSEMLPPFVINERLGFKIGIIGLVTHDLVNVADTQGMQASDYVSTLKKWVPKMRSQGAKVMVVVSHVPLNELADLAKALPELHIPLMLGGHSHELGQGKVQGYETWVVNSGEFWRSYSRVDLDTNPKNGKTTVLSSKQVWLQTKNPPRDEALAELIAGWDRKLDKSLLDSLGYTATGLKLFWPLSNLICDAWLQSDSKAQIALVNRGALRQSIEPGVVRKKDVFGLIPFNDKIYRIKISGKLLKEYLAKEELGMAGIYKKGEAYHLSKGGALPDDLKTYQVLVNNFMYNVSKKLKEADPSPETVWENWREPVEEWLKKKRSGPSRPLETLLDLSPRSE